MAVDRQRIYHKRDRLRQLRVFCHAARMESISRAAERLGLSQPAVSLQVRELEHEVEAMLFDRSGPRIALTSAGERLFRLANPMVEAMGPSARRIHRGARRPHLGRRPHDVRTVRSGLRPSPVPQAVSRRVPWHPAAGAERAGGRGAGASFGQ